VKFFLLVLKLAITGGLVWLLLDHVDLSTVGGFLSSRDAVLAVAICVGLFLLQALMAAVRARLIMRVMGADMPARLGFSTWMSGLFVSQTLVTFIAGDAVRAWQLVRCGYGRRLAGGAVFLERMVGLAVLMVMVLICLPLLLDAADGAVRSGLMVLAALCGVGLIGFVASGFTERIVGRLVPRLRTQRIAAGLLEIASVARLLPQSPRVSTAVLALSVAMHLCNALAFYAIGVAAGSDLSVVVTSVVALPVMLIALMPIALAGWGVREGAAAVGFGLFGLPAETAVTISVAFGLALLIASLPGALYLWKGRNAAGVDQGQPA